MPARMKIGMWELVSRHPSAEIADQIADILIRISHFDRPVNSVQGVVEAHIDLYASSLRVGDGYKFLEFELPTEQVAELARLGLSVRFSVTI